MVVHITFLLHASLHHTSSYALHYVMSSSYMRHITCITYVFNVRASSWTAKAAHSRKAEAPSYRGCPSPLRSFGAAPLTTTKLQIQARLRNRCSDLLAGQTTIKLRRTTLTCLIIIVFDRIAIFAKSVRVWQTLRGDWFSCMLCHARYVRFTFFHVLRKNGDRPLIR